MLTGKVQTLTDRQRASSVTHRAHTLSLYLSLTLALFFPTELPELFRVELTFRV